MTRARLYSNVVCTNHRLRENHNHPARALCSRPKSRKEVLDAFDKSAKEARAAIADSSDQQLMANWSLMRGGQTLMTMPRTAVLRSFVMNHIIHHRAQLGVYLRLNNVPVPSIYGPSADEGQLGG